jgi:DNA polymerase V
MQDLKLIKSKPKKRKDDLVRVTEIITPEILSELNLPIFLESVSAGFPSPADDYLEGKLDLNKHVIKNASSTFFLRVKGDSMIDAGIYSGDILVVDRALAPKNGSIVIAAIDGELIVKRLELSKSKIYLLPENSKYEKIEITTEMQFEIWGVVSTVIHSVL